MPPEAGAASGGIFVREFSGENEIVNFFDVGEMGIEHALLPEKGLIGCRRDVIIGCRFPYMYLRCPWCILHRCREVQIWQPVW